MQQRKYMNISRVKTKDLPGIRVGDHIVVQEKIDGANFSIRYDEESDKVCSFSRRFQLDEEHNLSGAWQWSQQLDKEKVAKIAELAVGDACTGSNPRAIDPANMEKLLTCIYYGTEVDF